MSSDAGRRLSALGAEFALLLTTAVATNSAAAAARSTMPALPVTAVAWRHFGAAQAHRFALAC